MENKGEQFHYDTLQEINTIQKYSWNKDTTPPIQTNVSSTPPKLSNPPPQEKCT